MDLWKLNIALRRENGQIDRQWTSQLFYFVEFFLQFWGLPLFGLNPTALTYVRFETFGLIIIAGSVSIGSAKIVERRWSHRVQENGIHLAIYLEAREQTEFSSLI